jgi:hypothetical protein
MLLILGVGKIQPYTAKQERRAQSGGNHPPIPLDSGICILGRITNVGLIMSIFKCKYPPILTHTVPANFGNTAPFSRGRI